MHIVVATDANRDYLVAEIHVVEGQPWVEIRYDLMREAYVASFFPGEGGVEVTADLAEIRRLLLEAQRILVARGYPDLPLP